MKLLGLLLLLPMLAFGQTTSPIPQAANEVPICMARCQILSVTDLSGRPFAGQFQFGSDGSWGLVFTPTAFPLEINYSNEANLGWATIDGAGFAPTLVAAVQTAVAYQVSWANFDAVPLTGVVTVPALPSAAPAPTPTPTPAPAPAPAPTSTCAVGQYAEIAGGRAGMTADVPAGVTYRVEPATTCSVQTTKTTVDISAGNLDVLTTASPMTIPATIGSQIDLIQIPASTYSGDNPTVPSNVTVVMGGVTLKCVTSNTAPMTCQVAP